VSRGRLEPKFDASHRAVGAAYAAISENSWRNGCDHHPFTG
jgi:hypothetical protein